LVKRRTLRTVTVRSTLAGLTAPHDETVRQNMSALPPPPPPPPPGPGPDRHVAPHDPAHLPGESTPSWAADTASLTIDPAQVAAFRRGDFHALSDAAVVAWRISAAFSLVAPLVVMSILLAVVAPGIAGIALLVSAPLFFGVFVWWLPKARWRRWRWRLGPEALHLRFGVVIRRSEHVPYFRIQHIELVNGPIERWLGLTTLTVTTASASGSAVLPGIAQSDAPALRQALLDQAQEAVHEHGGDSRDAV
jgi:uncharacterized protein